MTGLLAAEILKLRSARSTLIQLLLGVGLSIAFVAIAASVNSFALELDRGEILISLAAFANLFAIIIGVMCIGGDLRHGTIAPALLVTPRRERLLGGKIGAMVLVGAAMGFLAVGISLGLGAAILSARDVSLQMSGGEVLAAPFAGAAVSALYGVMGLGIGALLRSQTGAIVAALVLIFFIDPTITALFPEYAPYGLGNVNAAALGTPSQASIDDPVSQGVGLVLLALYAVAFLIAGAISFRRSDITD